MRSRRGPAFAGACAAATGTIVALCAWGQPGALASARASAAERSGYWVVRANGAVAGFGLAGLGGLSSVKIPSPIVGGAAEPRGDGYWLVAANGGVYSFGNAPFFGSPGGKRLNRPVVGMAATPDGRGYWLVASDGGIFAYGDATFYGSTGHIDLNKKIVGMAPTPDGRGYWLVASDGGVFAFGDARFFGSPGGERLNRPVVGMAVTPDGRGYWLVASDGGTFAYGDAGFYGSAGSTKLSSPAVAIAPAEGGQGYWVAEATGTVLHFGGAPALDPREEGSAPVQAGDGVKAVALLAPEHESGLGPPSSAAPTTAPGLATSSSVPATSPTTTLPVTESSVPSTTVPATSTTQPVKVQPTTTVPVTVPPYSTSYPAGATGYDVSWPQCAPLGSATPGTMPAAPLFAVVGVNGGTISTFNSCFSAEAAWAGRSLSVYIILQPAPSNSPEQETTGPEASCAATSSDCEGFDWGWNYAEADLAFVKAEGFTPKVWWVDVETGEGWPTSASLQPVNAAIVKGALEALETAGDVAGIYSTWYQWGQITGSYMPGGQPPIWVPGAFTVSGGNLSAVSYCDRALSPGDPSKLSSASIGFANGLPWLVQYGYGEAGTSEAGTSEAGTSEAGTSEAGTSNVDPDYSCA